MKWLKRKILNLGHWLGLHHQAHLSIEKIYKVTWATQVNVRCSYCNKILISEEYKDEKNAPDSRSAVW